MNTIKIITLTAAALASLSTAGLAAAAPVEEGARVEINTRGIDLNTADGVKRLTTVVRAAAHQVCSSNGSTDLASRMIERSCFDKAFASAKRQIDTMVARRQDHSSRLASAQPQTSPIGISQ